MMVTVGRCSLTSLANIYKILFTLSTNSPHIRCVLSVLSIEVRLDAIILPRFINAAVRDIQRYDLTELSILKLIFESDTDSVAHY